MRLKRPLATFVVGTATGPYCRSFASGGPHRKLKKKTVDIRAGPFQAKAGPSWHFGGVSWTFWPPPPTGCATSSGAQTPGPVSSALQSPASHNKTLVWTEQPCSSALEWNRLQWRPLPTSMPAAPGSEAHAERWQHVDIDGASLYR